MYGGSGSPGKEYPTAVPWPAMIGDCRYSIPGRETEVGSYGEDGKLTGSRLESFSAFGMGSRGLVDDGGALERENMWVRLNLIMGSPN